MIISLQVFKAEWKHYLWSSFITFGTFFIAALALMVKDFHTASVEQASLIGSFAALFRLAGKAAFEAILQFIIWLSNKIKS